MRGLETVVSSVLRFLFWIGWLSIAGVYVTFVLWVYAACVFQRDRRTQRRIVARRRRLRGW
jgi:hypothetical protein